MANTKIGKDFLDPTLLNSDTATTADVEPSTDRNYVPDAKITPLANLSGTNSGDDAINSSSAPAAHTHEGNTIDSTDALDGYVLTADGAGNADWEVAPAGGSSIAVSDDINGALTSAVTSFHFTGTGVTATNVGDAVTVDVPTPDIPVSGVDFDPVGTDNSDDNAVNILYSGLEASKQDNITLTTLDTSGAATFDGTTLNIPVYTGGGGGDVSKVATPLDNQVAVWTTSSTIEGTTGLTYDGTALGVTGDITVSGTVDGINIADRDAVLTTTTTTANAALPAASYTAADVLSKLLDVDGTGTLLDADLLDGLEATAFATAGQANVSTTLDITEVGDVITFSTDGTGDTLAVATITNAGAMSIGDKAKLDLIADGAEVNVQSDWNAESGDAFILNKPAIPTTGVDFDPVGTDNSDDDATNIQYADDYRAANFIADTHYQSVLAEGPFVDGDKTILDNIGSPEGTAILSTGEVGGNKFLREDGDGTSSWQLITGGGDALVSAPLSQFAATTSLQLAGVITDETGSGSLVFSTSPTLVTPSLGAATATTINGATITSGTLNGTVTGTNTGDVTLDVGALDYITLVGQVLTRNAIDLETDITNVLPLAHTPTIINSKLNTMGAKTLKGNATAGVATPLDLTVAEVNAMLATGVTEKNHALLTDGAGNARWALPANTLAKRVGDKVFILQTGQSNPQGLELATVQFPVNNRVFDFSTAPTLSVQQTQNPASPDFDWRAGPNPAIDKKSDWQTALEPYVGYLGGSTGNQVYAMADEIQKALDCDVYVLNISYGGVGIEWWEPGYTPAWGGALVSDLLDTFVPHCLGTTELTGVSYPDIVSWGQSESNAYSTLYCTPKEYKDRWLAVHELGQTNGWWDKDKSLFFLTEATEWVNWTGTTGGDPPWEYPWKWDGIDYVARYTGPNVQMVPSIGIEHGDNATGGAIQAGAAANTTFTPYVHYTGNGNNAYGRRIADVALGRMLPQSDSAVILERDRTPQLNGNLVGDGYTITGLGGLTVASGGATITAGGLTVTAGGITANAGNINGLTLSSSTTTTVGTALTITGLAGGGSRGIGVDNSGVVGAYTDNNWNFTSGTAPVLGGNLDANNKALEGVSYIEVLGTGATYTSMPSATISDQADQIYDYSVATLVPFNPPCVYYSGSKVMPQGGNQLGSAFLFYNKADFSFGTGAATTYGPMYSLTTGCKIDSIDRVMTNTILGHIDVFLAPTIKCSGTGSNTITAMVANVKCGINVIDAGTSVTYRTAFLANKATISAGGTLLHDSGLIIESITSGTTSNVNVVLGALTQSGIAGSWNIYQVDAKPNHWNGAQEFAYNKRSTILTLTDAHHIVELTGTTTRAFTFPAASTCPGRVYTLKKSGTGNITVTTVGGDTIDGAASPLTMSVAKQARTFVSDGGTNWSIIGGYL